VNKTASERHLRVAETCKAWRKRRRNESTKRETRVVVIKAVGSKDNSRNGKGKIIEGSAYYVSSTKAYDRLSYMSLKVQFVKAEREN
jgi:hypothetical protein